MTCITSNVLSFSFWGNLAEKPSEILRKLQVVFGGDCMSKSSVFEWMKRFKEGCESVNDDPQEGAPVRREC